jgi:hypothetical protein
VIVEHERDDSNVLMELVEERRSSVTYSRSSASGGKTTAGGRGSGNMYESLILVSASRLETTVDRGLSGMGECWRSTSSNAAISNKSLR